MFSAQNAHKTAIERSVASAPILWLNKTGRLTGRLLDYGCGRGKDAKRFNMESYDPHFAPERPKGLFDTITCTYVLNVVDKDTEDGILVKVKSLLNFEGKAYFTVRRDLKAKNKKGYRTQCGTFQRWVELDLPVIRDLSGSYTIYELSN